MHILRGFAEDERYFVAVAANTAGNNGRAKIIRLKAVSPCLAKSCRRETSGEGRSYPSTAGQWSKRLSICPAG